MTELEYQLDLEEFKKVLSIIVDTEEQPAYYAESNETHEKDIKLIKWALKISKTFKNMLLEITEDLGKEIYDFGSDLWKEKIQNKILNELESGR